MLLELYTKDTIMESEVSRKILSWYARFDLIAGLMAGCDTFLSRDWFSSYEQYYQEQARLNPKNIAVKFEAAIGGHRLVAMDMALLYAKLPRKEISIEDFTRENKRLSERISLWKDQLDPALLDPRYLVTSFERSCDIDPEDIVDPYVPGVLYKDELWPTNFLLLDWRATDMMQKYQTALILRQEQPPELRSLALELCRGFEAIEFWPNSRPGSVIKAQTNIGIASLFLPKDEKHTMWSRRKLALIESMG